MIFSKNSIQIDPATEVERIIAFLQKTVRQDCHRYGGVVGIQWWDKLIRGAWFGRARFRSWAGRSDNDAREGLDPETERLARMVASHYGVEPVLENITPALDGFGCYLRRDEAIRRVFPEYDATSGYKAKIVLPPNLLDEDTLNVFSLTIITPSGEQKSQRLPLKNYFQIVAASNLKQRTCMSLLYYHAELRNYSVIGTANKNEHDQGFFVKWGDGGADVMPIRHLFKTQVYQLAEYLEVPLVIRQREPTTDTYSAPTTQQEFFFRLPFETMDLLWFAQEQGVPVLEVAKVMGLTEVQVQRAYEDFIRKKRTTEYLRMQPLGM